jgi:MYXO-CTERM domain-containing protein
MARTEAIDRDRDRDRDRTSPVQLAARIVSALFLLVGIAGFIPGITEDAPGDFAGEDSPGSLLGVFQTGILHNLVHAAFGVVGLLMSRTPGGARSFLIGGGIVYVALFLVGMLGAMDWLPADDTDDWLHLGLGLGMLALAFLTGRRREPDYASDDRVGARAA